MKLRLLLTALLVLIPGLVFGQGFTIILPPGAGTGDVTLNGTQTLTNKTINADNNNVTNIGASEIKPDIISGQVEDTNAAAGEYFLYLNSSGQLRKLNVSNLPVSAGEANLASNIGAGGVGLYVSKSSVTLQFKNINAGSNKVSVANDAGNNEVDIDVVPANISILTLSGAPTSAVVGINDAQTLTNKTISGASNTITNLGASSIVAGLVTGQTQELTPATGDYLLGVESGGAIRKFDIGDIVAIGANLNTLGQLQIVCPSGEILKSSGGGIWTCQVTGDVTLGGTQTLTNKTLDAASNTITNIGASQITASIISGQTEDTSADAGEYFLYLNSAGQLRKLNVTNLPPQTGEANLASNIGSGGVGLYSSKSGVTLRFKNINAGSNKLSVTNDGINNEVDLDVVPSNIAIGSLSGAPSSSVVGISDSQTLTNKTIDAASNTITNIGASQIAPNIISGLPEDLSADAGEYFLFLNSVGQLQKLNVSSLPAQVGEANLASNIGVGGVGPYASKSGVTLRFKNLNAGSSKLSVTNDVANNEIDLDVVPANISLSTLSGAPASTAVGISDTQTLTNKTISGASNTITNLGASSIAAGLISGQTDEPSAEAGEYFLFLNGAGQLRKLNVSNLPTSTGEANLASNIGAGGVGLYASKSSVTLQFKNINAGSSKLSVTNDGVNNEVDLDVVPANISILALSGAPTGAVVGISDSQTLTNKTISGASNTISNLGASTITAGLVTGQTQELTPAAGDFLLGVESGGGIRKFDVGDILTLATGPLSDIAKFQIVCSSGQVLKSSGGGTWTCQADNGVTNIFGCTSATCTVLAPSGTAFVDLSNTTLASNSGLRLPGSFTDDFDNTSCNAANGAGQLCYQQDDGGSVWIGNGTQVFMLDSNRQRPITLPLADATPQIDHFHSYYACADSTIFTDFFDSLDGHTNWSNDWSFTLIALDTCGINFSLGSIIGNNNLPWIAQIGDTAKCTFSTDLDKWSCIPSSPTPSGGFEQILSTVVAPSLSTTDWVRIAPDATSPAVGSTNDGRLLIDIDGDYYADCYFIKSGGIPGLQCDAPNFIAAPSQAGGSIQFTKSDGTPCFSLVPSTGSVTLSNSCLNLDFSGSTTSKIRHLRSTAATVALTGADCHGGYFENGDADAIRYTLCDGETGGGQIVCFEDRAGGAITVDVNDVGESITLNTSTSALTAGHAVTLASGVGNGFCLKSDSATAWHVMPGAVGIITDGGA